MSLLHKDILGMQQLTIGEIEDILNTAANMKKILTSGNKKTAYLQGKTVITLFYENSTRTRMSFELAAKYLGAQAANISASGSSVSKGESLYDTALTLDHMAADMIIMRHSVSGAPHFLAPRLGASIINAGDGMDEHPTQALLDMLTIKEKKGGFNGLQVAIVGDLAHSRVVRSNIYGLLKMGANVRVFGPATLIPADLAGSGARICHSMEEALTGADVVMGLRLQLERQEKALFPSISEYSQFYGLNEPRIQMARPDAIVMHPGPMNRGVEISGGLADSPQSVIAEQVTSGVAVRMAILYLLNLYRNQNHLGFGESTEPVLI